jgi:hypothetical protein
MVEKAFNLAAQKLEFKFVTKKCKRVLYFIAIPSSKEAHA